MSTARRGTRPEANPRPQPRLFHLKFCVFRIHINQSSTKLTLVSAAVGELRPRQVTLRNVAVAARALIHVLASRNMYHTSQLLCRDLCVRVQLATWPVAMRCARGCTANSGSNSAESCPVFSNHMY